MVKRQGKAISAGTDSDRWLFFEYIFVDFVRLLDTWYRHRKSWVMFLEIISGKQGLIPSRVFFFFPTSVWMTFSRTRMQMPASTWPSWPGKPRKNLAGEAYPMIQSTWSQVKSQQPLMTLKATRIKWQLMICWCFWILKFWGEADRLLAKKMVMFWDTSNCRAAHSEVSPLLSAVSSPFLEAGNPISSVQTPM